jgi:hypothetical protein
MSSTKNNNKTSKNVLNQSITYKNNNLNNKNK